MAPYKTMSTVVVLPMPNHSMNSGTSENEGIGISALTSGRKKFSTGLKRAIRMPSVMPTAIASVEAEQHPRQRGAGVLEHAAVRQHAVRASPARSESSASGTRGK